MVQNIVERVDAASKKRNKPRLRVLRGRTGSRSRLQFVLQPLENIEPNGALSDAAKTGP